MTIAPYYQNLLEKALQAIKSLEPISFIGMFDSGVDYLFTISVPFLTSNLPEEITPVFVDISGLSTKDAIVAEISIAFADSLKTEPAQDYNALTKVILKQSNKTSVAFILYVGQEGIVGSGLLLFLNRVRNMLGWRFSYCIFATTRSLRESRPLAEKVFKRYLVPVLPLGPADSSVVLDNYVERYNASLSTDQRKLVIAFSGGNPGLIKSLYLQVKENKKWTRPDIGDEQLFFRLKGIASDLPLLNASSSQYYGYTINKKFFTPLLVDFLKTKVQKSREITQRSHAVVDETLLQFTKSQRSVLSYLREHSGELVSKDAIAQVLWGEHWADRYSAWAIDQLLSTLREKLSSIKSKEKIITKKGEGIIFTS